MKRIFDDAQLKQKTLAVLLDILNDAVLNDEGPLTISKLQHRLSQPPYQIDASREEIERTLHWGSAQPYAIANEFVKPVVSPDSRYRMAWTVIPKHHSIDVSSTKNATLTRDLSHSKLEEGLAIRSYRERTDEAKKLGDKKTAQLYEEVIKDERDHEEKFRRRLNQI